MSYGASLLTLITSCYEDRLLMYYLLNPPIGTSTVTVTFTGTPSHACGGSMSYFNVAGVESFNSSMTFRSNGVANVTVASNSGELVVGLVGAGTNAAPATAGPEQAPRWAQPTVGAMSDKAASSPTTTITYTLAGGEYTGAWDMIAATLLPATPVGGVLIPVDKLTLLAPYLALVDLVGAVATAAATRRHRS